MGSTVWISILLIGTWTSCVAAESLLIGGHLDNTKSHVTEDASADASLVLARTAEDHEMDLVAEESASSAASTPYPDQEARYKPYTFAFNGGKPFSLEKDPITGKIDFEKTPPLKALNLTNTYQDVQEESFEDANPSDGNGQLHPYGKIGYLDSKRVVSINSKNERVGPNEINPYSPSFHDFLNLPVRYNSDKYDRENYPLISNSYANTKVQSGSNSYQINNHRPYHQETATKVSISTATRKVYYPKSTTEDKTIVTTEQPITTSTTTTSKPLDKKTPPIKLTKPPTTPTTSTTTTTTPTTTTTTTTTSTPPPIMAPKITTWKPSKGSSHYDEYEDVLPIEKLQSSKYSTSMFGHYPINQESNAHNNGPQTPVRTTTHSTYDYNDGYEDYDSLFEEQPQPVNFQHQMHQQQQAETTPKIELTSTPTTSTTTTTPTTSTTTTSAPPTTVSSTSTNASPPSPEKIDEPVIHLTTSQPSMLPMVNQQQPVTSMPLDSGNRPINLPPVHENFVEGQRPIDFYKNNNNNNHIVHSTIHFPGNMYGRPGSVISVLPESTSNVIVPHDQDTVSFVLGNRQNVEGSYYTHGTAMEEHPYPPNLNENNFKPIFSSVTNAQQSPLDQKVSVALSSVAVVEPSVSSNYNSEKWISSDPMSQGSVKVNSMPGSDTQNTKVQSTIVFPSEHSGSNGHKDGSAHTEDMTVSGYVSFPESAKDKQNGPNLNPRPNIEEHIIVINQADGSIKEITPNGVNNLSDNSIVLNNVNTNMNNANNNNANGNNINNNNNNNNNLNLPQLSENLTPPAENRPPRPQIGGISQRPPYYFHYQHGNGPNTGKPSEYPPRPQRIPLAPRPPKPDLPPVGFKRRPTAPLDAKLPNILPQFRPNAKTSHGHRGSDKIGTLPAPQSYQNRPRPPMPQSPPSHSHPSRRPQPHPPISPPPVHLQRLSPPPPPHGHPPPHVHHQHPPMQQHQHQHNQPAILRPKEDSAAQPSAEHLKRYRPPVGPRLSTGQKLRMDDEITGERFSAEPPQMPPRPIIFPKNRADSQMPKVATLQMIQQMGALDKDMIRSNLPPLFKINRTDEKGEESGLDNDQNSALSNDADRRRDGDESEVQDATGASETGPVYVVYPVNSAVNIGSQEDLVERDESVVIGTRGPHRPLPPDTLLHDNEDKSGDDKLTGYIYGKRPHHNAVNTDFGSQGYPLDRADSSVLMQEKPLLVPSDDVGQDRNGDDSKKSEEAGPFNVLTYLQDLLPFSAKKQQPSQQSSPGAISATLPRLPLAQTSSSPIAYVYTPTTPPPTSSAHRHQDLRSDGGDDDDDDALPPASGEPPRPEQHARDEKPILLPSQQPSSSSSSAPSPQSFMAPFVASVSAEMPSRNGWSVVVASGQPANGTERAKDDGETSERPSAVGRGGENDAQTEKPEGSDNFDPENFKPQLFGGFKPIYEFSVDEEAHTPMVGRGVVARSEVQSVNVNAETGRMLRK